MPLNIDVFQILLHMLNFVILAGGLSLVLFNPVKAFLDKRREYFEKQNQENEKNRLENERLKSEYENKLRQSAEEIAAKRLEAEKEMTSAAKQCLDEARERADGIITAAEKNAEIHKKAILESAQTEIGELVVSAAQKLLNETETPERNSALYDDFIKLTDKSAADGNRSKK